MRSLSTYVIILPLIGVAAFYIDSSFLSFRTFLNVFDPGYVDTVFEINSIVCVIAVIGILYIINRSKDENAAADSGPTRLYNKILIITQSVIIFVILITLFQLRSNWDVQFCEYCCSIFNFLRDRFLLYCVNGIKILRLVQTWEGINGIKLWSNDVHLYCISRYFHNLCIV